MVLSRVTGQNPNAPIGTNPITEIAVGLLGVMRGYRPEQLNGDIRQGDSNVAILNDEIAAAAWPGPPHVNDKLTIDGVDWTIQGAFNVWDGTTLIGHDLWVRGG